MVSNKLITMEDISLVGENSKGYYITSREGKLYFPSKNSYYANNDVGLGLVQNIHIMYEKETFGFYTGVTIKTENLRTNNKLSQDTIYALSDFILGHLDLDSILSVHLWDCGKNGDLVLVFTNNDKIIVIGKIAGSKDFSVIVTYDNVNFYFANNGFDSLVRGIKFSPYCENINDALVPVFERKGVVLVDDTDIIDMLVREYQNLSDNIEIEVNVYANKYVEIFGSYTNYMLYRRDDDRIYNVKKPDFIRKEFKSDKKFFSKKDVEKFMVEHHIGVSYSDDSLDDRVVWFNGERFILRFLVNVNWCGVNFYTWKANKDELDKESKIYKERLKQIGKSITQSNIREFSKLSERAMLLDDRND